MSDGLVDALERGRGAGQSVIQALHPIQEGGLVHASLDGDHELHAVAPDSASEVRRVDQDIGYVLDDTGHTATSEVPERLDLGLLDASGRSMRTSGWQCCQGFAGGHGLLLHCEEQVQGRVCSWLGCCLKQSSTSCLSLSKDIALPQD